MDNNGWPTRTSTNPTVGGQRCDCGDIRTLHRSRGKRAKFLYSMCDQCGTDQRTGDPVQRVFKQFYVTKAELLVSEQAQPEKLVVIEETQEALPEPGNEITSTHEENTDARTTEIDNASNGTTQHEDRTNKPTETKAEPEKKHSGLLTIGLGLLIGGLTGGAIVKFS